MEATAEVHAAQSLLQSALKELKEREKEHRKETAELRRRLNSAREDLRKTRDYSEAAGEKLGEVEDRYSEHRQAAIDAARRWIATDEEEALEAFRFHHSEMEPLSALRNILLGEAGAGSRPSSGEERARVRELRKKLRGREDGLETERLKILSEALAECFRRSEYRLDWRDETTDVLGCVVPTDCETPIREVLQGEIPDEELRGSLDWAHRIVMNEDE